MTFSGQGSTSSTAGVQREPEPASGLGVSVVNTSTHLEPLAEGSGGNGTSSREVEIVDQDMTGMFICLFAQLGHANKMFGCF
jgi:hypothetical protein